MKKVLVMLGVLMFSASAFALNAQAGGEKTCEPQKTEFEQFAAAQPNDYFLTQYILINLSDPMETMSDEQAMPLALCYAQYNVKGKALVNFVRLHKGEFRPKEAGQLAAFANRVEILNEKADFDRVVAQHNNSFLVQHILSNMADPMLDMNDEQAAPKAKAYATWTVNGQPLVEFVHDHTHDYPMNVEIHLENFATRVERLAQ